MNAALRIIVPTGLALVLGLFLGTRLVPSSPTDPGNDPVEMTADTDEESARRIAELTLELERARDAADEARNERDRARLSLVSPDAQNPGGAIPTNAFAVSGREPRLITATDQARAIFDRAVAVGDLETLWTLGADLLALGPQGYSMFEELMAEFVMAMESGEALALRGAFRDEEIWVGRFFRAFAESHEDFLAYGLDVLSRDPETLSPAIAKIHHEILDDDFLPVLLAFNGGSNPELLGGWLDVLSSRLAAETVSSRDAETLIFGLAQIPDDRAVDAIVGYHAATGQRLDDVVRALILHGSNYGLQQAQSLISAIEDPQVRASFEQALGL